MAMVNHDSISQQFDPPPDNNRDTPLGHDNQTTAYMQCAKNLPLLAPGLAGSTYLNLVPTIYLETPRSDADWAPFYSEIERLYVRERRKLRYVMNFMETEYGVRAS